MRMPVPTDFIPWRNTSDKNLGAIRAKRYADADLLRPLADGVAEDTVHSDHRQQQCLTAAAETKIA